LKAWHLVPFVLALALAAALGAAQAEAQEAAVLRPSKSELNLIAGTPGSTIQPITYTGSVALPNGTVSCEVRVFPLDIFGLEARPEPSCTIDSSGPAPVARITVQVSFGGVYRGGSGSLVPFTAYLVYYDERGWSSFMSLEVEKLRVNQVGLSIKAEVSASPLRAAFYPPSPKVGETILIYTAGDVIIKAVVDRRPDVAVQLVLRYEQPTPGVSGVAQFTIGQGASGEVVVATLRDVSVTSVLRCWVLSGDGSVEVASGVFDLPRTIQNKMSAGIVLLQPYATIKYERQREIVVVKGGVLVVSFSGPERASVNVTLAVAGKRATVSIGPGNANQIIMFNVTDVGRDVSSGTYEVAAKAQDLVRGSVTVPFQLAGAFSLGGLIGRLLQYMFLILVGSSGMAIVLGLFLRQAAMVNAGLLGMAAATLVFLVPTLIAYVLSLAFATGIQDPADVGNVNMLTLGSAVERSITHVTNNAREIASRLASYATYLILAFIPLALLSIIVNALSGLAQFVLIWAALSFFAAHLLAVVGYAYAVVVTVAFIILFFAAVLYALYAAFTGDIGRALWPVMQFSMLVLVVLLVPPILATIETIPERADCLIPLHIGRMIKDAVSKIPLFGDILGKIIDFIAGLLGVDLDNWVLCIPPVFQWVAVTIVEIIILMAVMYTAINRVVSTLGGGL